MSPTERLNVINECRNSDDFILLLSYKIGSSGLNLQFADTVIILDYTWNSLQTRQAIARVLRKGQENKVTIYYTVSNTEFENQILQKHLDKIKISQEVAEGPIKSKVVKITISEVIELISREIGLNKLNQLKIK